MQFGSTTSTATEYISGNIAPDGRTSDPGIFSIKGQIPVGIKVGTEHRDAFEDAGLWRSTRRPSSRILLPRHLHQATGGRTAPVHVWTRLASRAIWIVGYSKRSNADVRLGLALQAELAASSDWFDWPSLPDLFPVSFPGVQTCRDGFLVDVDLDRLRTRIADYFDPGVSHEETSLRYPGVMKSTARYDACAVRDALLKRGGPDEAGFIRFAYRPFDNRWLYWEKDTKLLDEKRADYRPHVFEGNLWLVTQRKPRRDWSPPQVISHIGCLDLIDRGATCIPAWLRVDGMDYGDTGGRRPNLSAAAERYLDCISVGVEDLFYHVLATLHDPVYREANAGALRMDWPRIPLPGWPEGGADGAAKAILESAARGRELAALLDPDVPVQGVTLALLRPEIAAIAVPATVNGRNMAGDDFAVTASWGRYGKGDAVMPGQGRAIERAYTAIERAALGDALSAVGNTTFDIYLNGEAFWRNVPAAIWTYRLGGYQVLKKWLSYRERAILGRPLRSGEIQHFMDTARRVAAILSLPPANGGRE